MKKILLIIPAYNEEKNILDVYNNIIKYNKKNKTNYDVIVINDGSICLKNNIPTINLIHNLGIGGAVQTGYKYALKKDYDIAIQFDGDGQHSVESVKDLVEPIVSDKADFVLGSRFVDNSKDNFKSSLARRLGIKVISFFIKLVTGKRVYDTTSGFRACNKEIIKVFAYSYPTEYPEPITNTQLLKMNYRFKEVHANMKGREGGQSSIRSWKNIYYMINVILSIFVVGLRRYK